MKEKWKIITVYRFPESDDRLDLISHHSQSANWLHSLWILEVEIYNIGGYQVWEDQFSVKLLLNSHTKSQQTNNTMANEIGKYNQCIPEYG